MNHPKKQVQRRIFGTGLALIVGVAAVAAQGCGKSGKSGSFPDITPPIKAAVPSALKGSSFMAELRGQDLAQAISRAVQPRTVNSFLTNFYNDFFVTGPTVLLNITSSVDDRINFFNTGSTSSGCLSATPVAYTITPAGQSSPVTMYAQCYTTVTSAGSWDPGLIMIGQNNGVTYVWDANGAAWTAAIATPDGSSYDVHAWYSVGLGNGQSGSGSCGSTWDGCSYGVAEVYSNASSGAFEMTAAGIGVGYCGIQFASDGTNTYVTGSADGGSSCASLTSGTCLLNSDEATSASGGICSASSPFSHTTAVGISTGTHTSGQGGASFGPSTYPSTTNVTLNGTSTDSVHFGPTSPPSGVAQF
jgi:hypothetical protein